VTPAAASSAASSATASALPAVMVSFAPARPSVAQTTLPKAPVAPTTSADLPATSNSADVSMTGRVGAAVAERHRHLARDDQVYLAERPRVHRGTAAGQDMAQSHPRKVRTAGVEAL